ncbi:MAG TPA: NAD+ synthase [Phycisphaerae bacterium]|nr:NAD+ synthase [Phycisphaerae bacterium]
MRIALAQTNPIVGDIAGNCDKIKSRLAEARSAGADLVVFPELAICGYPPRDLVLKSRFVAAGAEAVSQLAQFTRTGPAALVGFVRHNPQPIGRNLHNALALLRRGRVVDEFYKSLLPTYDVFDEDRYFEPGQRTNVVDLDLGARCIRLGITICEDLWNDEHLVPHRLYHINPLDSLAQAGAQLVINSSASPFVVGKQDFREKLLGGQAAANKLPLIVVNQVGGNDELVFDGASCVFDPAGHVVARAKGFEEDMLIVDLDNLPASRIEPYPAPIASAWQALVLGTRDYVTKCRFHEVVIGLSGGIDSAITAVIAAEALGPERVHGIAMPSRYSSDHSIADAKTLAANLGIDFQIIPIAAMHDVYESQLTPFFKGKAPDITEENIQARIRGGILMALSNKFGWLLLTTGNKSELAVGYCTLYGDMCGGLAVISDVPKTMVYELARYVNQREGREVIPLSSITKPPSAELKPNQCDQDSLPEYAVLDAILHQYIEEEKTDKEIIAQGFDPATVRDVIRKVDTNEYKRKQAATGLKVTSRAFGVGRRMPIAARITWPEH